MAAMTDRAQPRLGAVQETLFIPLAARARAAQRRRPVLRDPKAVQIAESVEIDAKYGRGAGGSVTVLRTVLLDAWVRTFLARNPAGTVVEIGTGAEQPIRAGGQRPAALDRSGPAGHHRAAPDVLRRHGPPPDGRCVGDR
jgi:hypothetical protein